MTKLKCDACSCGYNSNYYCCVDGIQVGGKQATEEENTCCETFIESKGSMTNSIQTPNPSMEIGCKAINCVHNCHMKCEADEVCICGDNACDCEETKCGTFKCK